MLRLLFYFLFLNIASSQFLYAQCDLEALKELGQHLKKPNEKPPTQKVRFKDRVKISFYCVAGELCSPRFIRNFERDLEKGGIHLENVDIGGGGIARFGPNNNYLPPTTESMIRYFLENDYLFVVNKDIVTKPMFELASQLSDEQSIRRFIRVERFKNKTWTGRVKNENLRAALDSLEKTMNENPSWTPPLRNALTADSLLVEMGLLDLQRSRGREIISIPEVIIENERRRGNIIEPDSP